MLLNEEILQEAKKAIDEGKRIFNYGELKFFIIEEENFEVKKDEIFSFFTHKDQRWVVGLRGD